MRAASQDQGQDCAQAQVQQRNAVQEQQQEQHMATQQQTQLEIVGAQSTSIGPDGASITLNLPLGLTMMTNLPGERQHQAGPEVGGVGEEDADEPTSPQTITPHSLGRRLHVDGLEAEVGHGNDGASSERPPVNCAPFATTLDTTTHAQVETTGETRDDGDDDDEPTSPQTIRPNTIHISASTSEPPTPLEFQSRLSLSRPATANGDEHSSSPS